MWDEDDEAEQPVLIDLSRRGTPVYVIRGRPGAMDRPALPAGHPTTWGAITDGTVLDRATYPFPVFL